MNDVIIGLLAIAAGAIFCFRGYLTMRVIIPVWGAFVGFVLGAGLVAGPGDDGFLQSFLGWIVGIVVAVVFGLIAYLYYEVSIVMAMSAIGFALGTSLMVALGVTWSWVIIFVGLALGIALAIAAIVAELPMALLTVLTATAGASTIVAGLMLLFGVFDAEQVDTGSALLDQVNDDWWWYVIWAVVAIAGVVAQMRAVERMRMSLRESWASSGVNIRSDQQPGPSDGQGGTTTYGIR
jgi:hypothetical protein